MKRLLSILVYSMLVLPFTIAQKPAGLSGDLIIFHAGSLSVPMKEIKAEFNKLYPNVNVLMEPAGSVECARKITDLKKPCDIMAASDYKVIDKLLIPAYADWNIKFAANEMCIAYTDKAKYKDRINAKNWYEILLKQDVAFGRADPNADPCGYRTVMCMLLSETYYKKPGLAKQLSSKDLNYIRPKEVDLVALLESNNIDYIFQYRSVAVQHNLNYLILPDQVNLKNIKYADDYSKAVVDIKGKEPGKTEQMKGEPMVYGVTMIRNAPNKEAALAFLEFMLSKDKGMKIIKKAGQPSVIPMEEKNYAAVPGRLKPFVKKP
ncbi:MAG: tungstate ABC transporter substrate-binding protein WtpA [Bacteroidetes bacterium]|nr:tungstate ABC transporter substrate-binding protein WtpA [Bacteroidota bacterium]